MGLEYVVTKRVFGFDKDKNEKYVAKSVRSGKVNFAKMCRKVSELCGVHRKVVDLVVSGLVDKMAEDIDDGKSVRMMVNYRERLGGFFRIEQLQEIHLKAEKLRPWFSIDIQQTRRINLNKAGMERMLHHPYINYYQAKVIIEYRKKKGSLKSLKQLSLYEEFTPIDLERLEPYICYN